MDNIVKAKTEILENNNPPLIGIINSNSAYLVDYLKEKTNSKTELIWVGVENEKANIYASNIQITNKDTSFDIYIDGVLKANAKRNMGRHNTHQYSFWSADNCFAN